MAYVHKYTITIPRNNVADVGSNGSGSTVSLSRALLGLSSANDWCLNGSVQATADNKVRVKLIKKRSLTTIGQW